jgi:uncharacterized phage protein (TIGR02220 family)
VQIKIYGGAMRAGKTGLDYFPFDVDFFEDEKVEFIAAKHGVLGEIMSIKLLCRIYRNGYYLPWGEDEALLFAKRCAVPLDELQGIVNELVLRGFFSKKHFEIFSILTSNGIQRRFLEATRRRKSVEMYKEYTLVDTEGYNVYIIALNACNGTQRKEKGKRKERERKGKERINVPNGTPPPPGPESKTPDKIPYAEIIYYLNKKTGKNFDSSLPEYRKHIRARWNSGKRLEDFKTVIDKKVAAWAEDPKMVDFLRPQTLFGTKFDAYLNERGNPMRGVVSDKTSRSIGNLQEWIDEE